MNQSTNPKDRIGRTKPPVHLIPPTAVVEEAVVMGLGAAKYGPFNWRHHTVAASVYIGAANRHLLAWYDGEDRDLESGMSHLAHARACLGILLDAEANGMLVDDRPPEGHTAELIKRFTKIEEPQNGEPQQVRDEVQQAEVDWDATVADGLPEATFHPGATFHPAGDDLPPLAPRVYSRQPSISERKYLISGLLEQGCMYDVARAIAGGVSYPATSQLNKSAYISGPMRGYHNFNFDAFDTAREALTRRGFAVVSPADIDRTAGLNVEEADTPGASRQFCYRDFWAIFGLLDEGHIAVLPGWEQSTGAVAEVMLGRWLGMKIVHARDGEPLSPSHYNGRALNSALAGYLSR